MAELSTALARIAPGAPARWRWLAVWVVAAAAMVVVYLAHPDGWLGSVSYLSVDIIAAIAAWAGALAAPRGARRIQLAIAAAVTMFAAADTVWEMYLRVGGVEPAVSVGDFGWIGCYLAIALALLWLLKGRRQRHELDGFIDVAVVTVVTVLLAWEPGIAGLLADTSVPVAARLVWAAYPVLDAVIVALVIRVVVSRRATGTMPLLIAAGAGLWLVADYLFLLSPEVASARLLNAGWMLGAMLFAAATWFPVPARVEAGDDGDRIGAGRIGVALIPLAIPGTLQVVAHVRGDDINPVPGLVATILLLGLAFARTARISALERDAREQLRGRERYWSALATNSADAVIVVDDNGVVIGDFPRLADLVGYPGAPTLGADAGMLVSSLDLEEMRAVLARATATPGEVYAAEFRCRHGAGREIWLSARLVSRLDDADVGGVVINLHDITARKHAEAQLAHQAFHDSLTGLANRALFADRVEHALARGARAGVTSAVIFLDLDGFKTVNDSLGHDAGDDLLRQAAGRLLGALRASDTAARLGGDEFAVLVEHSNHPAEEAAAISDRILQALTEPMTVAGRSVTVSASVGIAVADRDATASSLLRDADVAMYQAKATGKARWVLYDGGMRAAAVERLELESDLIEALAADQFELVYQPVVELATGRVAGFEALLRWRHPVRGVVMPDAFVPIAEETGLIVPIGRWVLSTACRTAAMWQRTFEREVPLTMAVNVSGRQLATDGLIADVAAALRESDLPPETLVLEMTETVLVADAALAARRLTELRALGVRLAIDDFGTGYSSLSYLRQFPVDILKIDRSFIAAIHAGDQLPAIVHGLLDLGRTLKLQTVAEGIEAGGQFASLRDENCELGQGFLFARPLPPEDVELLLVQLDDGPIGITDATSV